MSVKELSVKINPPKKTIILKPIANTNASGNNL